MSKDLSDTKPCIVTCESFLRSRGDACSGTDLSIPLVDGRQASPIARSRSYSFRRTRRACRPTLGRTRSSSLRTSVPHPSHAIVFLPLSLFLFRSEADDLSAPRRHTGVPHRRPVQRVHHARLPSSIADHLRHQRVPGPNDQHRVLQTGRKDVRGQGDQAVPRPRGREGRVRVHRVHQGGEEAGQARL